MAMAMTLKDYLADLDIDYDVLEHPRSYDSAETAEVSHVSGTQLAKSVMLEDETGRYLLAVIPATHHVNLRELRRRYKVHMDLAAEMDVAEIFDDCELGAWRHSAYR